MDESVQLSNDSSSHTNGNGNITSNYVISTSDQVDHSYPYRNEVSLSIGNEDSPAILTPTPSPRSYKSDETIDVPTAHMENVSLTKRSDEPVLRAGLDNPGFDAEPTQKPARPLSSFGQNGGLSEVNLKGPNNNGSEKKPLAGNYSKSFIEMWLV